MARLSRPHGARRERGAGTGGSDRGQVLLVGALGLAVVLLVFAGVLNTVTYTESLATRGGDDAAEREVAGLQADAERAVAGVLERVNAGPGSYATKADTVEAAVANWSNNVDGQFARGGVGVGVSVESTTAGSLVRQNESRVLANASGTPDWTLAEDVSRTRGFRLHLDRSSLVTDPCGTGTCYEVVVDDGADTWTVAVNRSTVSVDGPAGSGTCAVGDDPVSLDLTAGIVGDDQCSALSFAEGLSTPYDVRFRNGGNATGTYRLMVDASVTDDGDYAATGNPTVTPAVYAAEVRVAYEGSDLTYVDVVRVARGEPDA